MNRSLRTLVLPAALASVLAVSACGSTAGTPGTAGTPAPDMGGMSQSSTTPASAGKPASGPHSDADVAFATGMVPHHAQAVQMADMALGQATKPEIKTLATEIKASQNPEIQTMSGWLVGWGKPVPTPGGSDMSGMGGSTGEPMGGMMSPKDMSDLGKATGTAFDRMWLQMMTKHHRSAITMAQTELSQGQNPDAKKLAQTIIDGQTKEITQMTGILATLPS